MTTQSIEEQAREAEAGYGADVEAVEGKAKTEPAPKPAPEPTPEPEVSEIPQREEQLKQTLADAESSRESIIESGAISEGDKEKELAKFDDSIKDIENKLKLIEESKEAEKNIAEIERAAAEGGYVVRIDGKDIELTTKVASDIISDTTKWQEWVDAVAKSKASPFVNTLTGEVNVHSALRAGVSPVDLQGIGLSMASIVKAKRENEAIDRWRKAEVQVVKIKAEQQAEYEESIIKSEQELKDFESNLKTLPEYLQDAYNKGGIEGYNEAVDEYNNIISLARAAFPPTGESYYLSEEDYKRANSEQFRKDFIRVTRPEGLTDSEYNQLKPYITPLRFDVEAAAKAKIPQSLIAKYLGIEQSSLQSYLETINIPLMPSILQMTGERFNIAESQFLNENPAVKRIWAKSAGVNINISSSDRVILQRVYTNSRLTEEDKKRLPIINDIVNNAWNSLSTEEKQRILVKYSPPPNIAGKAIEELFYVYPGTLIRPLEPILDPTSDAYKTWQEVKDLPFDNEERKAFVSYWKREGIKSALTMTTVSAPMIWSGVGTAGKIAISKVIPGLAAQQIGLPLEAGISAMATIENLPFIGSIPRAAVSLIQLSITGGAITATTASIYESLRSSDLQRKWEVFENLSVSKQNIQAKLAGYDKSFNELTDLEKANVLLRYSIPPGYTQAEWSNWLQENITAKIVELGDITAEHLGAITNTPLAPAVLFAEGAVLGVIEGLSYIPQIPLIAGQLADTIPDADPLEFTTNVLIGMAEFMTMILPQAIKKNPALGLGRTTGLFILNPSSLLRIVKSGIASTNLFKYIPERAIGREYGTIFIDLSPSQLRKMGNMTEAQLLRLKADIVKGLTTTGQPYNKILGKIKIKLETTPYQQTIGGKGGTRRLFHANPDITQFNGRTSLYGTLYSSPQLAMEAMQRSYLTGVKAKHPGVIEVLVPDSVAITRPNQLLPGIKKGGTAIELESELSHYIIEPVKGSQGKMISANSYVGSYPIKRFTLAEIVNEPAGLQFIRRSSGTMKQGTGLTVIGDLHATSTYLFEDINAGYTNKIIVGKAYDVRSWKWNGAEQVIVQLGDIIDRGTEYFTLRETFNRLHEEAAKTGGRVERLLGNHELAYLRGERIKGVEYFDRAKIREQLISDIKSGKVKAAVAINGQLFTHAGLSLSKFPEFKGKSAEYIANNLNKRLLNAVNSNNFYRDKIFDIGRVEHNSSFPRKGRAKEGGIFWHRYQETSQKNLDLGFNQFTGHSYDPQLLKVRMRQPHYIQTDVRRYYKGRGVYHDTPLIEPKFYEEVKGINTNIEKLSAVNRAKLRLAATRETIYDAILGWKWRMEVVKRQYETNKSMRAKVEDLNTQISELKKSKDPEAKLKIEELRYERDHITSPGFYEYLTLENDFALLTEIIRGRRYTVKITELGNKLIPKWLRREYIKNLNNLINRIYNDLKKKGANYTREILANMTIEDIERIRNKIKELDHKNVTIEEFKEVVNELGGNWDKFLSRLENELRNKTLKTEMNRILNRYYNSGEYPSRYISYADKAARIVLGASKSNRITPERAVEYLAYTNEPNYYMSVIKTREPRDYQSNRIIEERMFFDRYGIKDYEIYNPFVYDSYTSLSERTIYKSEERETPKYPSREEPTREEPREEPREEELKEEPPIEEPPTTIIRLKSSSESESEDKKKKKKLYPITFFHGKIRGWITIYPPYNNQSKIKITDNPPKNTTVIKEGGIGTAYKTIQSLNGDALGVKLAIDNGIQDIIITSPTRKPGKKGAIKFRRDLKQRTKLSLSLKGIRKNR